ncbi:MAG: GntR family transcriptional regulator [Mogibacterium sp.]|nr:GntR family transcriptional regulator [Mogibacterium sp.]
MKDSVSERIYKQLKLEIGKMNPRDSRVYTEQEVADKFNASRTPAREALSRLCDEGLMVKYPRKGYLVNATADNLLIEREQARMFIEGGIIRYIIDNIPDEMIKELYKYCDVRTSSSEESKRANNNFHIAMANLVGNDMLTGILTDLLVESPDHLYRPDDLPSRKAYAPTDTRHKMIIKHLLDRDPDKAVAAVKNDIMGHHTRKE